MIVIDNIVDVGEVLIILIMLKLLLILLWKPACISFHGYIITITKQRIKAVFPDLDLKNIVIVIGLR